MSGATIVLLVVVAVLLAALLALADRIAAAEAERRTAELLTDAFGRPPSVRVNGRPFLTQALRGRYRDVQVAGGGLRLGEITGATLDIELRNAWLSLRDLRGGRVTELPCERLLGRLVLPYGELARVARIPGLELRLRDGRLQATAALPVPGISQLARVTGRAELTLRGGSSVWLRIRGVSVAGIALPSVVLNQLLPSLDVPIRLPELPHGLQLDELRPTEAGLAVLGSADAVVLRRPQPPRPRPSPNGT